MPLIYPDTLTQDLQDAMRVMPAYVRKLAALYRLNGHTVGEREEDERAFVIDRHIRHVCQHGHMWDAAALEEYKQLSKRK